MFPAAVASLACLLCANACSTATVHKADAVDGACPAIAPPGAPYPHMSYVTVVINGKIAAARRRQLVEGPHSTKAVDSIPDLRRLEPRSIEEISFLPPDSAKTYERCPGVRVLSVRVKE